MAGGIEFTEMFASVGADISGFQRQMNKVDSIVNGFGKQFDAFGEVATGAMRRIGEGITDSIGKVFDTVGDIAKAGIDFNAMQEQATVAFETMLGSAEKAQSFLNEMQAFARKTPFEYPDLLVASRRLMALGFAADEVLPTLENIGNATAAMGGGQEMIDRVTTALGQMRAKGRVQAEEMMQLTENGIAAWDMLAKHLGVDVAKAMEMVTKKQVDAATGIEAIMDGINGRFGGMMAKQSTTWNGLISNLKDSFGMLSGRVMKPFFDVATKGLSWLVDLVSSNAFNKGIDNFVENITSGFGYLANVIERFRNEFSFELSILTSENASWGDKLIAVWDMLAQTGAKLFGSLADTLVKQLPKWLEDIGNWLVDNVPALFDQLGKWGKALWEWIVENTPKAIEKLGQWAGDLIDWLFTNLPKWAEAFADWAVETWEWLVEVTPKALDQLGKWGQQLWTWLSTNLPTWANNLAKWAESAWKWLADVIPLVGTQIGKWGEQLFNWLSTNAPTWWNTLKDWGAEAWEWLARVIPEIATQIGKWGSELLNWIAVNSPTWQAKLSEWGVHAWTWLKMAVPKVIETLGQWGEGLFGWLGENLPTFINTLLGWGSWLVNWISIAAPEAINALARFVEGLRGEGDNTGANKIGQMVAGWATKLWKWITEDATPLIAPAFLTFLSAISSAAGNVLTALGNLALQWGQTLWRWIETATPIVLTQLGEWGMKVWGWVAANAPIWAQKLGEWGRLAWQWIVDAWPTVSQKLGEWATNIWGWVTENAPILGGKLMQWAGVAWDWLTGAGGVIPVAATKLGEWATAIYAWVTDPKNVEKWSTKLWNWVDIAWDWLVGNEGVVWKAGEKLGEWSTAIYDWVSDQKNREGWVGELAKWATDGWKWIETDLVPNTTTWLTTWADIFTNSSQPGMAVVNYLGTTFPFAVNQAITAWQSAQTEFQLVTDAIALMFGDGSGQGLIHWLDFAFTEMIMLGSGFVSDLGHLITAAILLTQRDWEGALEELKAIGVRKWEDLGAHGENFKNIFTGQWEAAGTDLQRGFQAGWDKEVANSEGRVKGFTTFIPSVMKDELDMHSPSRVFEGFGLNVVEGFQQGFDKKWRTFETGNRTTVNSWKNWFANIFGIKSPSTVFEDYGLNIVAGLARGIEGASGMVYDAMNGLSMGMALEPSYAYEGSYVGASSNSTGANEEPTMREVVMELRLLRQALNDKNMSVTVNGGESGSGGIASFNSFQNGLRR